MLWPKEGRSKSGTALLAKKRGFFVEGRRRDGSLSFRGGPKHETRALSKAHRRTSKTRSEDGDKET